MCFAIFIHIHKHLGVIILYPLLSRHISPILPIFKFRLWKNNAGIWCALCMVTVTTINIHTKSFHKSIIFMCNEIASESIQTTQLSEEYTDLFVQTTAINIRIAQCVFFFLLKSVHLMWVESIERIVANRFSLD